MAYSWLTMAQVDSWLTMVQVYLNWEEMVGSTYNMNSQPYSGNVSERHGAQIVKEENSLSTCRYTH